MAKRRRKKLPDIPTEPVLVERLSHEGRGIANINGKTLFLRNALPQEEVLFSYTDTHAKFAEGYAREINNPSKERMTPKCKHYNRCGGCSTQHIGHDTQLQLKKKTLQENFQHFAGIELTSQMEPITGDIWHYRGKARLSCRYLSHANKVFLGFREINSRLITAGEHCPILHEKFSDLFEPLGTLISQLSCASDIPQVELSTGDNDQAIILRHLKPLESIDIEKLIKFGELQKLHIYLQPKGMDSIHKIYPEDGSDRLSYSLPEHQTTLQFHPTDFTQVNSDVNRKMVNQAISLLAPEDDDKVLDLFSGIGNFSLPIAKQCAEVVAVEGSELMVERGNENAKLNKINNIQFYSADLFKSIDNLPWSNEKFAKILLDPPRSGAEEIVKQINRFGAKRIVYVSCNPATLARDTKILIEQGYELIKAGIIDMFPHTSHVESMALFEKIT